MILEVHNDMLPEEISNANIALLDFWGDNCAYCKKLEPVLEDLSKEIASNFVIGKINADSSPNLVTEYKVRSLPCLIVLKNGEKQKKILGFKTLQELKSLVEEYSQ